MNLYLSFLGKATFRTVMEPSWSVNFQTEEEEEKRLPVETPAQMLSRCQQSHRDVEPDIAKFGAQDALHLRKNFNFLSYPRKRLLYKQMCFESGLKSDLELTMKIIKRGGQVGVPPRIYSESAVDMADSELRTGAATTMEKSENLVDVTGAVENKTDYGTADSNDNAVDHSLFLDQYFDRPIQIAEGALTLGSHSSIELPLWDLYTLDPAVRAKLRNYAFLKGNLHVRVMISGTPYHYGKVLLSYQPYNDRNDNITYLNTNIAVNSVFRQNMVAYLSQSPGAIVMDIRENKPVEMEAPFISSKTTHKLYNDSALAISDVTSFEDLSEAGSLYMYTVNVPKAINATVDAPHYYVYAWMTNVELGPPTGTQVAIRTESKVDERESGPVEKFSSGAAEVSSKLEDVPYIGPFATASRIAFGALSSVSAIFGWSKPIVPRDPVYVKNMAFQNGAQTIGYSTNTAITLDPKQELTVDGQVVGSDKDEMVIKEIASRCSYLTTVTWSPSDAPLSSSIFLCPVAPNLGTINSHTTTFIQTPSPMMFCVQPFEFWRGDVEFTIEVVCSQFHRGKFAVVYEPNIEQITLIAANLNLNKQYVKVIDIQETQTVTFRVNWAHYRSWALNASRNGATTSYYTHATIPQVLPGMNNCNGVITVVPMTELISPDGNAVEMNIYVKCPNLRVNRFTSARLPTTRKIAGAESAHYIISESQIDGCALSSQEVTVFHLNDPVSDPDTLSLEYFGEEPVSFRALMKRYVTQSQASATLVAQALSTITVTFPMYPLSNCPYGTSTSASMSILDYLRYAYVGIRGGMRARINVSTNADRIAHDYRKVTMSAVSLTSGVFGIAQTAMTSQPRNEIDGTVMYDLDSNGGLEVELPFYSNNRMLFAFAEDYIGSNPGSYTNLYSRLTNRFYYYFNLKDVALNDVVYGEISMASAEDFCLLRFQGCPSFA